MTARPRPRLRGADAAAVESALRADEPLSGIGGFAGRLGDRLVRDVLGREPLFVDDDSGEWAFTPRELDDPVPFPAGHATDRETLGPPDPLAEAGRALSLPDPDPVDRSDGVDGVRSALASVAADVPEDCPVAFSGGVDSGTVAAMTDGPLYAVGFPESHDLQAAREAADAMDRRLHVVELSHDRLREAVPRVVEATGRTNQMDVSIAVPLYLAAEQGAADGHDRLALGQGADELFGGYAKVANAPGDTRVEADTVRRATREVLRELPHQLARDVPTLRAAGVEPVTPLLRDEVVRTALRLPAGALVDGDRRKAALRAAARPLVPASVAERDKKAVQYGSYVSRELDRLAHRAGFKRRTENHVGRYVRSVVE
jgi:asparagine synthase (glutamine-hydrolysing)